MLQLVKKMEDLIKYYESYTQKTLENVQKWLFFTQSLIKNMFKELKIEKKIVETSFPVFLDNLGQFSKIS